MQILLGTVVPFAGSADTVLAEALQKTGVGRPQVA